MVSFYNLLRVILMLYLGCFTYALYQLLFYHQKRFLFIKTIIFFFIIAILIIKASNKYDVILFHVYIIFYLIGILLAKKYLAKIVKRNNQEFNIILTPLKKLMRIVLKIICIPPIIKKIKEKRMQYKYYKLHPHLKPKSIYELF